MPLERGLRGMETQGADCYTRLPCGKTCGNSGADTVFGFWIARWFRTVKAEVGKDGLDGGYLGFDSVWFMEDSVCAYGNGA